MHQYFTNQFCFVGAIVASSKMTVSGETETSSPGPKYNIPIAIHSVSKTTVQPDEMVLEQVVKHTIGQFVGANLVRLYFHGLGQASPN